MVRRRRRLVSIEPTQALVSRGLNPRDASPDGLTHATWLSLGFTNIPGDRTTNGVSVNSNYKGPGKDRAVYELKIK